MQKLLFTLFIFLLSHLAFSQGFQVNFQGQKQQGMGGAGTALPLDGASLFFNPGSTSFLKENSINLAMTPTFARTLFVDANTNQSARTNSPMGTPFSAYAVYRKSAESKLFFGIAAYTPFGSTVQWEDGWMGRFALTRLELKSIFIQPTISVKLTEKVGLGVGFVYCTGNVNLQKDLPVMDASGNYGHAELAGKIGFGLTYRSQVNMSVSKGQATFVVPTSLEANFPNGSFSSSLPLPQVVTLGFSYKPTDKLSLALDVNYVGWKAYDTLAFDYETNTSSLSDTKSVRSYENIFAFRGGANYNFTDKIAARIGMAYGISPVQNGYVTPETPDANRINYTAGLSYKLGKHFALDASIFFTHLKRTDTNIETNLSGTFTTNVVAPGLAVIYRF